MISGDIEAILADLVSSHGVSLPAMSQLKGLCPETWISNRSLEKTIVMNFITDFINILDFIIICIFVTEYIQLASNEEQNVACIKVKVHGKEWCHTKATSSNEYLHNCHVKPPSKISLVVILNAHQ